MICFLGRPIPATASKEQREKEWHAFHDPMLPQASDTAIGGRVIAASPSQAGPDLFPGCRLALVLADGEPGAEMD